ncbi:MAG: histidine kinase dimerization/phospho-acceptor domain-containing protein [Planctomycetota bacterium]
MRSIRGFLTLWLTVGVTALTALAGLALYLHLDRTWSSSFDDVTRSKARALASLLERDRGKIEFGYDAAIMPEFARADEAEYFEIRLLATGKRTLSRSYPRRDLIFPEDLAALEEPFDVRLPDGRSGRALALEFDVPDRPESVTGAVPPTNDDPFPAVVIVARSREGLDGTLAELKTALVVVALVFGGLALLGVRLSVGRGLAPLADQARRAQRIDARTLDDRLPVAGQPQEVAEFTASINALLERLEESFARERRMTANLAHELRTPIAELRSTAEVSERWPDDAESREALLAVSLQVAGRMESIVRGLLRLARIESGAVTPRRVAFAAGDLLAEQWRARERAAVDRELEFRLEDRLPGVALHSDPELLGLVFGTLLDNVVAHAPPRARITAVLRPAAAGAIRCEIGNPAPEIRDEDLPRLSEPFWCRSDSRTARDRTGLGLALARRLAGALGGAIDFARVEGRLVVGLTLPTG